MAKNTQINLILKIQAEQRKNESYFAAVFNAPARYSEELMHKIIEACHISDRTVYRWLSGESEIPHLAKEKIAEIMNIDIETLFPETINA